MTQDHKIRVYDALEHKYSGSKQARGVPDAARGSRAVLLSLRLTHTGRSRGHNHPQQYPPPCVNHTSKYTWHATPFPSEYITQQRILLCTASDYLSVLGRLSGTHCDVPRCCRAAQQQRPRHILRANSPLTKIEKRRGYPTDTLTSGAAIPTP